MPFVARNRKGAIIVAFKDKNECAREEVSPDDCELCAFLGQNGSPAVAREQALNRSRVRQHLRHSDMDFVRVLDDLIAALMNKGMIVFTDLPPEAQRKLMLRRGLRDKARELKGLVAESEEFRLS